MHAGFHIIICVLYSMCLIWRKLKQPTLYSVMGLPKATRTARVLDLYIY